jgi:endonuclease/exonuclease/phosphatase family metal-dependent hydrolase
MRAAVIARFRDRVSGRSLCMLNTHYDINLGQLNSSQLVAKILNETCQTDDSVFMTGDLNAPPDSAAVLYLVNAGPIFGQYTPIPLYETLKAANAGGPTWIGGSFSSQVTENKIDYIFSRRDAFTCLQSGKVITDTFTAWDPLTATENRQSCSDHAVVQSSFCIGTGCTNCLV